MSDSSWMLQDVDPETLRRAGAEAARLGMSVTDYIAGVLLQQAGAAPVERHNAVQQSPQRVVAAPEPEAGFAPRHRLEALERRVGLAVGGLESAVRALDGSVCELAARVDSAEAAAASGGAARQSLDHMSLELAALRQRLAEAEEAIEQAAAATPDDSLIAEQYGRLEHRIGAIENLARAAAASAAETGDEHEQLKHAVADDFAEFARETIERVDSGLAEARSAANAAGARADAAAAHLVAELRGVRETLERRHAESAAETRARMQAAFADISERVSALSQRLEDGERAAQQNAEQLRAELTEIDDRARAALDSAAEGLRQTDAALAADLDRLGEEHRAGLDRLHAELANDISELRERQQSGLARLKQIDAALSSAASDIAQVRGGAARQAAETAAAIAQRFDAVSMRVTGHERAAAEAHASLRAETERVEACTLAALEKLSRDLAEGGARGDASLRRLESEFDGLRKQHAAAQSRINRLETAVEAAPGAPAYEQLREHIRALAAKLDQPRSDPALTKSMAEIRARLAGLETQAGESAGRVQELARTLSGATSHAAEAATLADARLHKLEAAVAELVRERAFSEEVALVERRVIETEQRQDQALVKLQDEIAGFLAANERRLAALEADGDGDLAHEFEALRQRLEERILGVELRSVRTLEQVAETVAVLEQRLTGRGQDERESA